MRDLRATQAEKILDFLTRSQQDGWRIEIENGSVYAKRVAVGGKCGPATEWDSGLRISREDLRDGLAHVLQTIVTEVEMGRRAAAPLERSE